MSGVGIFLLIIVAMLYFLLKNKNKKPVRKLGGGRSIVIHKPIKNVPNPKFELHVENIPDDVGVRVVDGLNNKVAEIKFEFSVSSNKSDEYILIAHLSRTATKHHNANNTELGIQYLKEMRRLMEIANDHYTIWQWLRLANFLKRIGRFEEAINDCHYLLVRLQKKIDHLYVNSNPYHKKAIFHGERSEIHLLMMKIYKSAKMLDECSHYGALFNADRSMRERQHKSLEKNALLAKQGDAKACERMGHWWGIIPNTHAEKQQCKYCGKIRDYQNSYPN